MDIVFINNYDLFTFTDTWCESYESKMINYDINKESWFQVSKIELKQESKIIEKTITKKKLFRTIQEKISEEIIEYYIFIDYQPFSYNKKISTVKIHVLPEELENAKKVVEYINDLIAQKNKKDEEKRLAEQKHKQMLVDAEKKRLEQCLYDVVVIDFETTGIKAPYDALVSDGKYDEILSVSIIDQDGNVLLNSLCKPQRRKSWPKAQEIHGISPAMVKGKPSFEELFPTIKEILYKSKLVLAYNIEFERKFLIGFDCLFENPGGTHLKDNVVWGPDPMLMYSAYKGTERWQKLSSAAKHFKFTFEAHDSLEDVKATLHCYKKMLKYVNKNQDKNYVIKYGYIYDHGKKGEWLDLNTFEITDEEALVKNQRG